MTYEVTIRADHPTGVFHREGIEFSKVPVVFDSKPPKAILEEPWLVVAEVGKQATVKSLPDEPVAELKAEAEEAARIQRRS